MGKNYKNITMRDLEQEGGIKKLERDGFSRLDIHKALYNQTDGASQQYRTKLMEKLYNRRRDGL